MSKTDIKRKKIISGTQMSRQDIVDAVSNPDSVTILGETPKSFFIPTSSDMKANFDKLVGDMSVDPGSELHKVLLLFCKEKRASSVNAKVLISRIRNLNDAQLKVVGILCKKKQFTATNILKSITSIRKFDKTRLLALRSFIDLENVDSSNLNHFFTNTLPQVNRREAGDEAYENEIKNKIMSPAQYIVFYNICRQIERIMPSDAIDILRKIREIKPQHTKIINSFFKKNVVFGEKPITADNVIKFIKLWAILPEIKSNKKFVRFMNRMNKKKEKKMDFQYIISEYKDEIVNERSKGKWLEFFRRLFG